MNVSGINSIWTQPRHPHNGAWLIDWAVINQYRADLFVDEEGGLWASLQEPGDDDVEYRRIAVTVEGWFRRQLFLLDHGYASDSKCRAEERLPPGLCLCEDLSDAAPQVYVDGDAVWLVEERRIQRMSRHVSPVAEVLAAVARAWGR